MVETIFDTLNAKAAIFAIEELFDETRRRASGDDLRHDHRSLRPHALRANHRSLLEFAAPCAAVQPSGSTARSAPKQIRPHVAELSRVADTLVSRYPNAGLPNAFGGMTKPGDDGGHHGRVRGQGPRQHRRRLLRHDARAYPRASPKALPGCRRATCRRREQKLRLSGLEPFKPERHRHAIFINIGERTNVTGSAKFTQADPAGDLRSRAPGRAPAGRERRADHRRQHGRRPCSIRKPPWCAS